ncbi:hypothetical protein WOLCODRAFT_111625 [Wolfiporia cocos MD-104 SS10]|uniref:RINT-1 family protein n=1 Tax=Wolfiporia cocos (strain MD-104) TaxID=742152 RepID=A0A2H3J6Q2_WOLCO|nr:hypothetical protein WOLCODRAFT_111625 [Wolfiporia cocos MD-104 SS10]
MASAQIQALLQPPSRSQSEQRTLDFLNSQFTTLSDLTGTDAFSCAVADAQQRDVALKEQLAQSRAAADALIAQTRQSAQAQLHTAQELSLLRHSLSDEVSYLSQQLVSSFSESTETVGPTLLEDLETLHRSLKELESVKAYVRVVQRALQLSEAAVKQVRADTALASVSDYEALQHFVSSVQQACSKVDEVAGQQQLHIFTFIQSLTRKTWTDMKNVLSGALLLAAEKLHWPMPVDYLAASLEDRRAFELAFANLLKLQTIGKKVHDQSTDKEGLYPIQALVQPVALRFKYHFEGARQTNRLDKPEWYFTHILNVVHEHRPFMENVLQTLLSTTEYQNIVAWREFALLLLPMLERKLRRTVPSLLVHPPVLAHTIYEALAFDISLKEEGFGVRGTSSESSSADDASADKWDGISEVILGRKEWFEAWMEGERQFAMDQYMDIISASDAWLIADDDNGDDDIVADRELRPTNSARRVKALVEQITDRYSPLPQFVHRTRFLIAVQLPILELYHSRISSSLDAFETLSSAFMRAVPGALGSVGSDSGGRAGDPKRLTSGIEGAQRLCKALISARYIAAACEGWGEELFFLELWAEINRRASLRARAEAAAALPEPTAGDAEAPEDTIFGELVQQYGKLAERAEDMLVQFVCGEVEAGLRAHFSGGAQVTPDPSAQDDITLVPTLVGPLALLSGHLSFLRATLSRTTATSLYRRIAAHLASHILQRQILYRGRGRVSAEEGRAVLAECELWVETCQVALVHSERARVEAPWRQLIQASRLLGAEGARWQEALDATFGVTGDQEWEDKMLEIAGFADLSRQEVAQILRVRADCVQ